MTLIKVIFLDIDGVLNNERSWHTLKALGVEVKLVEAELSDNQSIKKMLDNIDSFDIEIDYRP